MHLPFGFWFFFLRETREEAYTHIYIYIYIEREREDIYIYIYIEREREREREMVSQPPSFYASSKVKPHKWKPKSDNQQRSLNQPHFNSNLGKSQKG